MAGTTNEEVVEEVRAVKALIPGTGATRLATEEFIRKQIGDLKNAAAPPPKEEKPKEEKAEEKKASAVDELLTLLGLKDIVDRFKKAEFSMQFVVGTAGAIIALIGVKLLSFDTLVKDVLARKNKVLGSKYGLPRLEPAPPVTEPTPLPSASDLNNLKEATTRLNGSVTQLSGNVQLLSQRIGEGSA